MERSRIFIDGAIRTMNNLNKKIDGVGCHKKLLGLFRGDGKNGAKLTPIHEY